MNTSLTRSEPITSDSFSTQATNVLGRLRATLVGMFSSAPGGIRKSYDANKLLGVDARLSWQIFKLTGPGDPLSLAPHVPFPAAMKRLLAAAARHQINPDRIAAVKHAFDSFERLVQEQAGDRSIFETMTRGFADDDALQPNDIAHRKAIFKGHRHYLATETETFIMTVINHPSAISGKVDIGNMRARLGMRRLRNESQIVIDRASISNADHNIGPICNSFTPDIAHENGFALLTEYCTQPLPALKFSEGPNRLHMTMLDDSIAGRHVPMDLVFANVWRDIPFLSPDKNAILGFGTHCHITCPTVRQVMDVLIPRATANHFEAMVDVYGFAGGDGNVAEIQQTQTRIFFQEKIVRLAGGIAGSQIREVPQYTQMLKSFCDRLDWRTEEFEVFRYAVEYPILGSLISLRFNRTSM